jgi:hypothetical protein
MKPKTNLMRELIGGFGIFVVVLIFSLLLRSRLAYTFWGPIVILAPVFPAIFLGYIMARSIGLLDELQQRIQLEALAFSLANTALLTFVLGLMQIEGEMYINLTWVLPIAAAFWGIGLFIARRRYK